MALGPLALLVLCVTSSVSGGQLPEAIKNEIQAHKDDVRRIIDHVLTGPGRYEAISRLANLTDRFGPRNTGSQALEDSIDFARDELQAQGFTVKLENVMAENWVRNEETAAITAPYYRQMALMSLGSSEHADNIEAEVVVVKDYDELDAKANQDVNVFKDKIVLYNMEWRGYGDTVIYRNNGASRAAKHGAVAALIRSVTQYSIYSPHTGQQRYDDAVSTKRIPIAAIAVEDAHLIQRYYNRGQTVRVNLNMTCENHGTIKTRNIIAEYPGESKADEVVIIGGHIDSWDVGNGVMDDGGGVIVSWQSLLNMKALGLKPKRTVRAIFWTAEEIGLIGAQQYFDAHKTENDSISLIMESDYGTFKPLGVGFTGSSKARDILTEILSLLSPINATGVDDDGSSPDTGMWLDIGVPGANLWNQNDKYFFYHHSHGDSITMQDPDDLDLCAIVWTVVPYIVANLEDKLPRSGEYPANPNFGCRPEFTTSVLAVCMCVAVSTAKYMWRH